MILGRYIAGRFARILGLVIAGFAGILFFVELVEQLRRFSGSGVGLAGASGLSLLLLPGRLYAILALIVLLAAIGLFLALARSSEMVAIRASGRSALRFLIAPGLVAALVGAAGVAVLNPIVAATTKRYAAASAAMQAGGTQALGLEGGAVWLRQSLPGGGQVVIRAARAGTDATTLTDAQFVVFRDGAGPQRRLQAREAVLADGAWNLSEVKEWDLTAPNPEATAITQGTLSLPSDLTPERIRDSVGDPAVVPVWQLPAFIRGLEQAGFSARRHRVWLAAEAARPALLAAMVLVAAAFTLHHVRGARSGLRVLAAFGAGLGLFFLGQLTQVLGENGDLPPTLAAFAAPAAAALLALGRILRLEDG